MRSNSRLPRGLRKRSAPWNTASITIDLAAFGGSALTDHAIAVPEAPTTGIPITYVPARNTIFLAYALGWGEVLGARDIFVGVNAVDYSGYPDCRPEFIARSSGWPISRRRRASKATDFAFTRR